MPRRKKQSTEQKLRKLKERQRNRRQQQDVHAVEQAANTASRQRSRQNPARRAAEQESNTAARRSARLAQNRRAVEQEINTAARRSTRQNPARRAAERVADSVARRSVRQTPARRAAEQEADTAARRQVRQTPAKRSCEQNRDTTARRSARLNPQKRAQDASIDLAAKRKIRRKKPATAVSTGPCFVELRNKFNEFIRRQPSYICACCGTTRYQESTTVCSKESLESFFPMDKIPQVLCVPNIWRFCNTCYIYIKKKKVPRLALSNGLAFPPIPPELKDLNVVERTMISLRVAFMRLYAVGNTYPFRQYRLQGNIVNVPNELDDTVSILPRQFDQTFMIPIQFMRRSSYKHPYVKGIVSPYKIYKALATLMTTELYQESGVALSHEWQHRQEGDFVEYVMDESELVPSSPEPEAQLEADEQVADNEVLIPQELTSAETARIPQETLIVPDIVPPNPFANQQNQQQCQDDPASVTKIAPCQHNTPIPLFMDLAAEEMAFPDIYCGIKRKAVPGLSYTDIAKSEALRYDRRACYPQKILYSYKKSFNQKVHESFTMCLRKKKAGQKVTAQQALNPAFLSGLLSHDEGFAWFKKVRSTPSFWKDKSRDLLAYIRQLGKPAIFLTVSAAEARWWELLVLLKKQLHGVSITEDEAKELSSQEIADLIKQDPINCMRHFEHRFRGLLNFLLKPKNGIFRPHDVLDYFFRLEFQMRGSPHMHGLIYLQDAPNFIEGDNQSERECASFIDKFMTCERDTSGSAAEFIKYQNHKHDKDGCFKKGRKRCRYMMPRPPLPRTRILSPLPKEYDPTLKLAAEQRWEAIEGHLNDLGPQNEEKTPFVTFLSQLKVTEEEYIEAIRSSLRRTTVFLRRETDAIFINNYNAELLASWGANMDIQFVIDEFACARYVSAYMTKSEEKTSQLLRAANKEAKRGNLSVQETMNKQAGVLCNSGEISAQEASAFILGLPYTYATRQVQYINTVPADERVAMLKSAKDLRELPDDSEDTCSKGMIHYYARRPQELDNVCLAEFVSWFEYQRAKNPRNKQNEVSSDEDCDPVDSVTTLPVYKLNDSSGYVRKRSKGKVLRFRRYSEAQDPDNYYREQLLLFLPWRDEDKDIPRTGCQQKAQLYGMFLQDNRKFVYAPNVLTEEEMERIAADALVTDDWEDVVVENEYDLVADTSEPTEEIDTNSSRCVTVSTFLPPKLVDFEQYQTIMRNLTERQRKFVLNLLYCLRTTNEQFLGFLEGGAGVGKSFSINAIVQSLLRRHETGSASQIADFDPLEEAPVRVAAYTGKAACNVDGVTLHGLLKLSPSQAPINRIVGESSAGTLRKTLKGLKLLIIDEISMVSADMMQEIDWRLQQVFYNSRPFGGCSVLVVGHLWQLPPVMAIQPFEPCKALRGKGPTINPVWELFPLYQLTEIKRQEGHFQFCRALNNMAEGMMDSEDFELLSTRRIYSDDEAPRDAIRLFFTNPECDSYNDKYHASLDTERAVSYSYDRVEGKASQSVRRTLLKDAKKLNQSESDGLRYAVPLQLEAEYYVTTNINVEDGLFNGSTGTLKRIEYGKTPKGQTIPKSIWMDFHSTNIGAQQRQSTRQYQMKHNIPLTWTRIDRYTRCLRKQMKQDSYVVRSQIPVAAANGMTVHKSQGSSLKEVVVCMKPRARTARRSQIYVACSRCTSLEGLYLLADPKAAFSKCMATYTKTVQQMKLQQPVEKKMSKGKMKSNAQKKEEFEKVEEAMTRLKSRPLKFKLRFFQDVPQSKLKLFFHNIQSFPNHSADLSADQSIMCSDLILLVEPKLMEEDDAQINGFQTAYRYNAPSRTSSLGVIVLQRNDVECTNFDTTSYQHNTSHATFTQFLVSGVRVVVFYKSPRYPRTEFLMYLEECVLKSTLPTIVFGDSNINLKDSTFQITQKFPTFKYLLDCKESSTVSNTHIDWCFSNINTSEAWFYETYFSHHKGICCLLDK